MTFEETLRDLLAEKNIGVQTLSKSTNIDDSVLYDYLHGSIPTIKYAVILANFFNCSLNYLMGIDETPNDYEFNSKYNIALFSDRYDSLLKTHNIAHFRLSKTVGLNYSSHYAWQHGAIPSMQSLIIIARYFGTSIDYLIGRSNII